MSATFYHNSCSCRLSNLLQKIFANDLHDFVPFQNEYSFPKNANVFSDSQPSTQLKSTMNVTNNTAVSSNKRSKSLSSNIPFNNNRSSTQNNQRKKSHPIGKPRIPKRKSHTQTYLPNESLSKKEQNKNNKSLQQICWFSISSPWLKRLAYVQNNDIILNTDYRQQILFNETSNNL